MKKLNVMGHISGTADRLNLSVRKRVMMAASTSNALGIPLSTTNISVTSAWRHGHKVRKTLAKEVKKMFDPDRQFVLHWDGKTMNMRRGEKSNFVAIYLTTVDGTKKHHLLDIQGDPLKSTPPKFVILKYCVCHTVALLVFLFLKTSLLHLLSPCVS